jgi:metal transporter CNNM
MLGGLAGFFISTIINVLSGEIIPQAVCSRYALQIGAATVYMIYVFTATTIIITYPISKVLDKVLGEE